MKVVRRSDNKLWVFLGGRAFVIRLEKEVRLIPRWRVASALAFSSFASAIAFASGGTVAGVLLGLVAVILTWAASR